jgi:hypothetical protein
MGSNASISYVLDLIEFLFNGWPLERPKHVATPNVYFNIMLELCLTYSSVDILFWFNTPSHLSYKSVYAQD